MLGHRSMDRKLLSAEAQTMLDLPNVRHVNCIPQLQCLIHARPSLCFQRGNITMGMSDMNMADQLYHYMVGGHKIPLVRELFSAPMHVYSGLIVRQGACLSEPGATVIFFI